MKKYVGIIAVLTLSGCVSSGEQWLFENKISIVKEAPDYTKFTYFDVHQEEDKVVFYGKLERRNKRRHRRSRITGHMDFQVRAPGREEIQILDVPIRKSGIYADHGSFTIEIPQSLPAESIITITHHDSSSHNE